MHALPSASRTDSTTSITEIDSMIPMLLSLLAFSDDPKPITPGDLHEALQVPPRGGPAEALAARIRAAYPKDTDFRTGRHAPLVEESLVAFIVEAPADSNPRVAGMLNHGRPLDLIPIGT